MKRECVKEKKTIKEQKTIQGHQHYSLQHNETTEPAPESELRLLYYYLIFFLS